MQVDPWESGNPYEYFMGRWSRPVAHKFLEWLSVADNQRWLDIGCGTGALSSAILSLAAPQEILAVDASETFIAFAQQTLQDPHLRFQVSDACNLAAETDYFDAVVSGLVLNFIPDPATALSEMARAARAGGVVAIYVWDYAGEMQMLRYFWEAATAIDPAAKALDEGSRFPICQPSALETLFQEQISKRLKFGPLMCPLYSQILRITGPLF